MKTCPNPKCKTTGIPYDANFCPICGETILSPKQLKKKKRERMNGLKKEAQQAWNVYPDKPHPKKNPYSILLKVTLFLGIIVGIIIYKYLMQEYGATYMAVPEGVIMIIRIVAYTIIGLFVLFILKSRSFNHNEEMEKVKEIFIANYISEHEEK